MSQPIPAYRNPSLSVEERVADLLSQMTLEEKVGQLIMWDARPTDLSFINTRQPGSILHILGEKLKRAMASFTITAVAPSVSSSWRKGRPRTTGISSAARYPRLTSNRRAPVRTPEPGGPARTDTDGLPIISIGVLEPSDADTTTGSA